MKRGVVSDNRAHVRCAGRNFWRHVLFEKILMLAVWLHLDNQHIGVDDLFQASALRVGSKE
jgi:hypothetical protein